MNTSSLSGRVESQVTDPSDPFARARRPWWAWAVPFAAILVTLVARNAFLFSTPLHEDADMGANSLLIEQARRFTLLVGHYSREKFNHPGPAFLYVQSWGESLFWSGLHVVPTPWNGQLIAVYALNALFAAFLVALGYGWTRPLGRRWGLSGALAVFAAMMLYGALYPAIFSDQWMPYVFVPAYLTFVAAIASVAAGRTGDLWIAAVAGWFLIHGYASFLLFVPVMTGCAVLALAWPRRRRLRAALRSFFARQRGVWVPALVISALFLVPIVAEVALHWPGNFGKYFSYTSSSRSGHHTLRQAAEYLLWFWWPGSHVVALVVALVLFAASCVAAWRCPAGPLRRVCVSLVAFNVISTAATLAYALDAIDELNEHYIAYFYWSAPLLTVLVILLALIGLAAEATAQRARPLLATVVTVVAGLAAVAVFAVFAASPQTRTSTTTVDPNRPPSQAPTDASLPAGVARLAAVSGGRPVVLRFDHDSWPEMTGILLQAQRSGVRACVATPGWGFMMTSQLNCTHAELRDGKPFWVFVNAKVPPTAPVVFRFQTSTVTSKPS